MGTPQLCDGYAMALGWGHHSIGMGTPWHWDGDAMALALVAMTPGAIAARWGLKRVGMKVVL